ncbi:hypothetical protein UACE39S_03325 [Ureibacillus acetophenoni]
MLTFTQCKMEELETYLIPLNLMNNTDIKFNMKIIIKQRFLAVVRIKNIYWTCGLRWDSLNETYHPNGTLIQPIEGWVDPLSALYPVDIGRNGKYGLLGLQLIAGRYHADGLGYVENQLHWDGRTFSIVRQSVAIPGEG